MSQHVSKTQKAVYTRFFRFFSKCLYIYVYPLPNHWCVTAVLSADVYCNATILEKVLRTRGRVESMSEY